MKLVIVESPTKAKTISKFLDKTYKIKSSFGHVRDLPKSDMGIDIEKDFAPKYVIPTKAKAKVAELKDLAEDAEEIILATDEDREGEAISWHLAHILKIKDNDVKRIVFHEITKNAILKALENPRKLDLNLVDAQQARRVLDRLVGYELSPFLWKKVRYGLSAGRVQSIALRFIVEREREIEKFEKQPYWIIQAVFSKGEEFSTDLVERDGKKIDETITMKLFAGDYKTKKTNITDQKTADEILADLQKSAFKVIAVTAKEITKTPPPPYTTSSLQQSAINVLGFSAKQTMSVAQKLYEKGFITYMRTDSVNLSLESMIATRKTIENIFGKKYALPDPRFYNTKSKGAQEAHEAIRPTNPEKSPDLLEDDIEPQELKLYRLIWNRMIACQMQPAILSSVKAEIEATNPTSKNVYLFKANGSTVKFDGYMKVQGTKSADNEKLLPPLKQGDVLDLVSADSEEKSTTPPPRYNEASIVKVLEENGIGRPSTYAPTISTIIDRKYVEKDEQRRLYPLEIGSLVNDILVANFPEIVSIKFTATVEADFDLVAEGKLKWVPVIREFYGPFKKNLDAKHTDVKKEDLLQKMDHKCPTCGGDLIMKFGRFGKFIACSNFPTCKYTEKTKEEQAVEQENSGVICDKCGAPMVVKRGRFGTFLGCSKYPECKGIMKIEKKLGIKCPKCKTGEIVEKKSKKGKMFFGCNSYPNCDFVSWSKPTGDLCEKCGSLMAFAAKGKTKCTNKECGAEK